MNYEATKKTGGRVSIQDEEEFQRHCMLLQPNISCLFIDSRIVNERDSRQKTKAGDRKLQSKVSHGKALKAEEDAGQNISECAPDLAAPLGFTDRLEGLLGYFYPAMLPLRYIFSEVDETIEAAETSTLAELENLDLRDLLDDSPPTKVHMPPLDTIRREAPSSGIKYRCKLYLFGQQLESVRSYETAEAARESIAKFAFEIMSEFHWLIHQPSDRRFSLMFQKIVARLQEYQRAAGDDNRPSKNSITTGEPEPLKDSGKLLGINEIVARALAHSLKPSAESMGHLHPTDTASKITVAELACQKPFPGYTARMDQRAAKNNPKNNIPKAKIARPGVADNSSNIPTLGTSIHLSGAATCSEVPGGKSWVSLLNDTCQKTHQAKPYFTFDAGLEQHTFVARVESFLGRRFESAACTRKADAKEQVAKQICEELDARGLVGIARGDEYRQRQMKKHKITMSTQAQFM